MSEESIEDIKESLRKTKQLLDMANQTIIKLQTQNGKLQTDVITYINKCMNLEKEVVINKTIVQSTITNANETQERMAVDIQELKDKIKKFEG